MSERRHRRPHARTQTGACSGGRAVCLTTRSRLLRCRLWELFSQFSCYQQHLPVQKLGPQRQNRDGQPVWHARSAPSSRHARERQLSARSGQSQLDVMDVCFSSRFGHRSPPEPRQLCANFGSGDAHSMILSARIRIVGGTVKFEALAVLRLTTSSNVVGCSTGMSDGFAPLRMRSTISAPRRHCAPWSVP